MSDDKSKVVTLRGEEFDQEQGDFFENAKGFYDKIGGHAVTMVMRTPRGDMAVVSNEDDNLSVVGCLQMGVMSVMKE
jgi:hypothetical protein